MRINWMLRQSFNSLHVKINHSKSKTNETHSFCKNSHSNISIWNIKCSSKDVSLSLIWIVNCELVKEVNFNLSPVEDRYARGVVGTNKKNNLHEITQIVVIDSVDRISHFQFVIGERSFKWSLCNWAWVMGIMVGPIKRKLIHCRKICRNQRIKIRLGCVSSSRSFQRQKNL